MKRTTMLFLSIFIACCVGGSAPVCISTDTIDQCYKEGGFPVSDCAAQCYRIKYYGNTFNEEDEIIMNILRTNQDDGRCDR
jgi:hypothetical protein